MDPMEMWIAWEVTTENLNKNKTQKMQNLVTLFNFCF